MEPAKAPIEKIRLLWNMYPKVVKIEEYKTTIDLGEGLLVSLAIGTKYNHHLRVGDEVKLTLDLTQERSDAQTL